MKVVAWKAGKTPDSSTGRPTTKGRAERYHTDRECKYIRSRSDDAVIPMTAEDVARTTLTECAYCAGDVDEAEVRQRECDCPICGTTVNGNMPAHITTEHAD